MLISEESRLALMSRSESTSSFDSSSIAGCVAVLVIDGVSKSRVLAGESSVSMIPFV
jgi:hypothetical protein